MGRKPLEYEYKQKIFKLPVYLCKKLDTIPNQTQFVIGSLERSLELNNNTLERLFKRKKQLEIELSETDGEIAERQKEELTKVKLKETELERFLKDRYNRLCETIDSSEFPDYYITNKDKYKEIKEKYLIDLDQETIDKIKQNSFSFEEYQNHIPKNSKILQEVDKNV